MSIILHGGSGEQVEANDGPTATGTTSAVQFPNPRRLTEVEKAFEQFRVASGLAADDPLKQVNTLLYCIGEEKESVLTSTNTTEDERKVYQTVLDKFDSFFKVRRNVIYERIRFNRRNQLENETAEQYIMELYRLAESCDYGALRNEMIRDRLVVGIRDAALSQQLQLDAELTLEKAKKRIRQKEAVGQQQKELKASAEGTTSLEELRFRRKPKKGQHPHNLNHASSSRPRRPHLLRRRVEKSHTPAKNAPQRMQVAIGSTRRDITVPNVSLNQCQKSAVRAYLIQHFWTQSEANRLLHGSPPSS